MLYESTYMKISILGGQVRIIHYINKIVYENLLSLSVKVLNQIDSFLS